MQDELLCMHSAAAQQQGTAEAHVQGQIIFSSGDCYAVTSEEVKYFQSSGSHSSPKRVLTHMKLVVSNVSRMDFVYPSSLKSLSPLTEAKALLEVAHSCS